MESPTGESDLMSGKAVVITAAHLESGAPGLHSFPNPPTGTKGSSNSLLFLLFVIEFFLYLGLLLY